MEYFDIYHQAIQKEQVELRGSLVEDFLFIRFQFFKTFQFRRVREGPCIINTIDLVGQVDYRVKFSHLKQQLSSDDSDRYYETLFSEALSSLGFPKDEHPAAVQTLFLYLEGIVDPMLPVFLGVFDTVVVEADVTLDPDLPNWIPASRAFIQGLKPVTLDDDIIECSSCCSICLEDFEQEVHITQLPCTHHFHLHCIVECLEVNHTCPLCRYEMPVEEED